MAVVLSSEENNFFSSSGLRRSHSQPKFGTRHSGFHTSASTSRLGDFYQQPAKPAVESTSSSPPSSPGAIHVESAELSCSSTPASNFSLASDCDDAVHLDAAHNDERIILPEYDDVLFFNQLEDLEPPPSPRTGDSYAPSPNDHETSTTSTSRPETPELQDRPEDDIAVKAQPSRHVDYLSHNWREEDIWSSWKLIVSRRGDYSNAARLENASWRTWMKSKNKLRTIAPESLNWLKDCDVTWLYGPLQTGSATIDTTYTETSSARLSKSNSFINNKKPILKKRSVSEIMLQRSLSTSSLVKQAAAAVQAQQKEGGGRTGGRRPGIRRAATDYMTFPFSSRNPSRDNLHLTPSIATSGLVSPSGERKHIHFNEQVAQCIAVDVKGDDDEEDTDRHAYDDSDSDDGSIMMKRTVPKKRRLILKRSKSSTGNGESKTIAMLPSTTLKYRQDTPEPPETAMKHSTGVYRSPAISPSSSQETLRPSKPSGKLFIAFDEDDDDEADDDAADSSLGWTSPPRFAEEGSSHIEQSSSSSSLTAEPEGMRRTSSGMFMPYEEGEPASANDGIFGRVIDTVNTARDIAHVIWNVGWRK